MTAAQRKSRSAGHTAEAADHEGAGEEAYDGGAAKASEQKGDGFAAFRGRWIEHGLRDHGLSDGAFRVLASIAYDFLHRKKRAAWPAQDTLAEAVGMPVRTVQRHVAELKSRGHLRVDQRGRDKSNIYRPAFYDAPKMAGHDKPMTRQNLRDDPPNPASKTRHRRRTTLLNDHIDDHRRAQSAPADSDQSDYRRDAHLTGASPDPVSHQVGQSINLPDHGQCVIVRRGTTIATNRTDEEFEIVLLLVKSSGGVEFACPVVVENGQETLRSHRMVRWDEMTDESRKRVRWDRMEADRASA